MCSPVSGMVSLLFVLLAPWARSVPALCFVLLYVFSFQLKSRCTHRRSEGKGKHCSERTPLHCCDGGAVLAAALRTGPFTEEISDHHRRRRRRREARSPWEVPLWDTGRNREGRDTTSGEAEPDHESCDSRALASHCVCSLGESRKHRHQGVHLVRHYDCIPHVRSRCVCHQALERAARVSGSAATAGRRRRRRRAMTSRQTESQFIRTAKRVWQIRNRVFGGLAGDERREFAVCSLQLEAPIWLRESRQEG